jgi:hypothetical protein
MAFPHIKRGTPNGSFTKCYPCSRFILLPMFPVAPRQIPATVLKAAGHDFLLDAKLNRAM